MRHVVAVSVLLALASAASGASNLTRAGKLDVGVTTVTAVDASRADRAVTTELWYPARRGGRDAAPLPRKYPLVIVVHGFCGSRLYYDYLAPHLASWGFIVAAPDLKGFTRTDCDAGPITARADELPLDLSFVCRELHDVAGPLGTWAEHVRGIPTALVGNSFGGLISADAARIDPSFTTIVGLAAAVPAAMAPALGDLHRAWMVMGATDDDTVSFTGVTEPFFEQLPAPSYLVRFTGGSHTGFSDENPETEPDPRQAQHDVAKRYATPFLLKYLAQKKKFGRRLRPTDDGIVALIARPR